MIPKGYVSLADAINRVGERKYGEGAWLEGGAVKLNRELRPRDLTELEHRKTAVGQWLEVTEIMRREFVGTPQDHADAVPVRLQSDGDNNSYPIPPQIWLDDIQASKMFKSGTAAFWPGKYPKLFNGGWSPTAAPLSGRILIPEASLLLLINGMALLGQPTGTVFQEGKTETLAARGVSETPPEPNVTEGSDAKLKGNGGEQPSRQEKRSQAKQEMYKTWSQLALKYGYTDDGIKRTREKIAGKIASDPNAKDPLTGASPTGSTVKRRLDEDYAGWAEKSWAEKTGRNSCPR